MARLRGSGLGLRVRSAHPIRNPRPVRTPPAIAATPRLASNPLPNKILDFGAGTGLVGERLRALGHRYVTAADKSAAMLVSVQRT